MQPQQEIARLMEEGIRQEPGAKKWGALIQCGG